MKEKYYSVDAIGGKYDCIVFHKDEDGNVCIAMEGEELRFSVKAAKEIAEKLKKCAND